MTQTPLEAMAAVNPPLNSAGVLLICTHCYTPGVYLWLPGSFTLKPTPLAAFVLSVALQATTPLVEHRCYGTEKPLQMRTCWRSLEGFSSVPHRCWCWCCRGDIFNHQDRLWARKYPSFSSGARPAWRVHYINDVWCVTPRAPAFRIHTRLKLLPRCILLHTNRA